MYVCMCGCMYVCMLHHPLQLHCLSLVSDEYVCEQVCTSVKYSDIVCGKELPFSAFRKDPKGACACVRVGLWFSPGREVSNSVDVLVHVHLTPSTHTQRTGKYGLLYCCQDCELKIIELKRNIASKGDV